MVIAVGHYTINIFQVFNDFLSQTAKLLKTLSLRYLVRRWYLKCLGGWTLLAEQWMAPINTKWPRSFMISVRKLGFKFQLGLIYWENWTGIWFTQYLIKLSCMEAHGCVLDCHFSWTNLVIYVFYPGSVKWLILICFDINPWVLSNTCCPQKLMGKIKTPTCDTTKGNKHRKKHNHLEWNENYILLS